MARLIGIPLMLLGIYVGLTVYTEGADHAFGGLLAGASGDAAEDAAAVTAGVSPSAPSQQAAPAARQPITVRVRDRVQGAVDERADRLDSY
jgi:hypothetical protein